jgi:hypothetical protein
MPEMAVGVKQKHGTDCCPQVSPQVLRLKTDARWVHFPWPELHADLVHVKSRRPAGSDAPWNRAVFPGMLHT